MSKILLAFLLFFAAPAAADGLKEYYSTLDYSCMGDEDCVVKNIGNCCGYQPGCINRSAAVDASLAKLACGTVTQPPGVCGFVMVQSCYCEKNRCQPLYPGQKRPPPVVEEEEE